MRKRCTAIRINIKPEEQYLAYVGFGWAEMVVRGRTFGLKERPRWMYLAHLGNVVSSLGTGI